MKKKKIFYKLFILILFCTILGIINTYATDNVASYDNLFASNNFTLNTDVEINDDQSLSDVTYRVAGAFGISDYYNSQNDYAYLRITVNDCNYSTMKCNFSLYRDKYENNVGSSELIKNYDNISMVVNSNISSDFTMVNNNDNVVINYDESMFSSDYEKDNYIMNYFNNLQGNNANSHYYYSYNSYDKLLTRTDSVNGKTNKVSIKKINDITFEYTEEPFSDEFKKLTETSTLTIKTDGDITTNLLSRHFGYFYQGNSSFSTDGEIKNNKVFIKRTEYVNGQSVVMEKHLITLEKDTNIDLDNFDRVGYKTTANIPADEPTNKRDYATNYFNVTHYQFNNADNSYEYFDEITDYSNYNPVIIQYRKTNSQGKVVDIEYHTIPVVFTGYSNQVSEGYNNLVGDKLVINTDSLSLESINNNLNYRLRALSCNNDYSMCDIAYDDYQNNYVEIHNVAIELSNEISDDFKTAFNIKEDGKIDIIKDDDVVLSYGSIYYSYYNEKNGDSLSYNCYSNNKCNLSLRNYVKNKSESHEVAYNFVTSNPTSSYLSLAKQSVDIYPGEMEDVWNRLRYNYQFFSKKKNSTNTRTDYCDPITSKCSVITLNSDNNIEMHNATVNLKEGKSSKFNEYFPGNSIKITSVYKDDPDYLDRVSMAYLMSKTKTWSYLTDYSNGQGKIVYDGFETHTMNVNFEEANPEYQQIVNEALSKIDNENLDVTMDDMEYVNSFYYDEPNQPSAVNFNSKNLYEKLTKIIDNKHISYFFVEEGGLGSYFFSEIGGKVALFYDGVAYGLTDSMMRASMKHIIYIPDNTEDTPEAYVKAAQKRVDDYLGKNSGVTISYEGLIDYSEVGQEVIDEELFDGRNYLITHKDKEARILIIKDSSKMKTSTFNAIDVNNNVVVSSYNAAYPTNTVVSSEQYNNSNYKEILNKLGLKDAQIVDINLYSPSIGNIDNFNNVNFDVSVPINLKNYRGKKLYAYYIKEDGSIEEHEIDIDDFIANFKTTHFSTYIISEKIDDKIIDELNPNTGDKIIKYIILALTSITGLTFLKKKSGKLN